MGVSVECRDNRRMRLFIDNMAMEYIAKRMVHKSREIMREIRVL